MCTDTLTASAAREAYRLGHHWVGVEHLLLALTREPRGTAVADALAAIGVTTAAVEALLRDMETPPRPADVGENVVASSTPAFLGVEGRAEGFALAAGSREPCPEHVLLALVWYSGGAWPLTRLGVDPKAVQAALAAHGVPVPPFDPPTPIELGDVVEVSADELQALLDRIEPLLAPPKVTVAVRRDGDRAWVRAAKVIDVAGELERLRSDSIEKH